MTPKEVTVTPTEQAAAEAKSELTAQRGIKKHAEQVYKPKGSRTPKRAGAGGSSRRKSSTPKKRGVSKKGGRIRVSRKKTEDALSRHYQKGRGGKKRGRK